jgi:hypothetical protein
MATSHHVLWFLCCYSPVGMQSPGEVGKKQPEEQVRRLDFPPPGMNKNWKAKCQQEKLTWEAREKARSAGRHVSLPRPKLCPSSRVCPRPPRPGSGGAACARTAALEANTLDSWHCTCRTSMAKNESIFNIVI